MTKKIKITKEMILDASFEIVRKSGLEALSNRELAKKLNCSIQPIYYQFKNSQELQDELYFKIEKYFYNFLLENKIAGIPEYKQIGINYIKFAKEESKLFQILFVSDLGLSTNAFIENSIEDYKRIENSVNSSTKLDKEKIKQFHTKMWIFTHGLATLVASNTIVIADKELEELLSQEFQALMLLEETPHNKWVNKEKENKNENN